MKFRDWSFPLFLGLLLACTGSDPTPPPSPATGTQCSAAPDAPGALRSTELTSSSVKLVWNAPAAAAHCTLSYSVLQNGTTVVATPATTSATIDGLVAGTLYSFSVKSVNEAGASGPSATILVKSPPVPVGLWTFDDPSNLTAAQIGNALTAVGAPKAAAGPADGNGAVTLDADSYFAIDHGIAPNGDGSNVNQWTLMMDIRVPALGGYNSLFQTDPANSDDGDCFIDAGGFIGSGATRYSDTPISEDSWYRLVIVVDNGRRFDVYLDGKYVLWGTPGDVDDRFSLLSQLLLCADNDGERMPIDIAEVRLFDHALNYVDVEALGGYSHADNGPLQTGPYLQNVKTDGIAILWETEENGADTLEYGTSTSYGTVQAATSSLSASNTSIHKAVLTGLQSGTTYHYRVNSGGGHTADNTFKTAPDSAVDFSFGVWGDSQGSNSANPADPMEPTKSFMKHMVNDEHVDLAITTGDLAEDGNAPGDVRAYFLNRPVQIIGNKVPFFIAWGNHDMERGSLIRQYVDLPSQERSGMDAGCGSYSFDYAGCHFICIDNYPEDPETSDVAGWVRQDLQSEATKAAKFTFVFIHRAPWYDRWYEGEEWLRTELVPYLEQSGVAICFSGHMHGYERGSLNGVYYVTTGGGSWLDTDEPLVHDWPNITVGGYHNEPSTINNGLVNEYVKIEISGDTCTARMLAFNPDGSYLGELDSFQITH